MKALKVWNCIVSMLLFVEKRWKSFQCSCSELNVVKFEIVGVFVAF